MGGWGFRGSLWEWQLEPTAGHLAVRCRGTAANGPASLNGCCSDLWRTDRPSLTARAWDRAGWEETTYGTAWQGKGTELSLPSLLAVGLHREQDLHVPRGSVFLHPLIRASPHQHYLHNAHQGATEGPVLVVTRSVPR